MALDKGKSIFWTLYALFFAVPFPAFIYYAVTYFGDGDSPALLATNNPYLALAYLVVAVIFWLIIIFRLFRAWLVAPAAIQRQRSELQREGTVREAEVITARPVGEKRADGARQLDVTFRFNNLSGVPIREKLRVVDIRPALNRFAVGQHLRLRVDKTLTKDPVFVLENSEFQVSSTGRFLAFLWWLVLVGVVTSFFILSYRYENQGSGWRFLTFYHPLLICPLAVMTMRRLFRGTLARLFGDEKVTIQLKYRGLRTDARLLEASQTGTSINDQPEVRFELEYDDVKGNKHFITHKKIVRLIDTHITKAKTIPIFYLPDQPETIGFASDLGGDDE